MSDGGFLSDNYKPVFSIFCRNCSKSIGSTNDNQNARAVYFCNKCANEFTENVKDAKLNIKALEDLNKRIKEGF
jgi:Zn finger protein HypA/HybF involved in hydrogenase expression